MAKKPIPQDEVRKRNQAAKGFINPAQERKIQELQGENSQLRMSVLNMRQMFEGATQEKLGLQSQVQNLQNMLTAAVVQGRGHSIKIKAKAIESVDQYAGLDSKVEDGDLILTALSAEQVEEMQIDLGEDEPTQED